MATKATKLPSGNWRVRVQLPSSDGKQHYKSFTAPTRKEAEYQAAQYAYTQKLPAKTGANITVADAIEAYISNRENVLSPSTLRSYKTIQRKHFDGTGSIRLNALTPLDAQRLINLVSPGRSPKTVREIYSLFRVSVRQFLPDFSPAVNLPGKIRHEMVIPEQADILRLLDLADDSPMYNALLLAAAYGLRRGEISALTTDDLNQEDKTLTINKAYAKAPDLRWVLKAPKSYAGTRTIKITDDVIAALMAHKSTNTARLCCMSPDAITCRFEHLRAKIGISVRFHDLRHYNASLMLSLNVPDKYAMERLGQATPSMIKAVYQHIIDNKREAVNDEVNQAVSIFAQKYATKNDTENQKH